MVSSLNKHTEDVRLVFEHNGSQVKKTEEEKRKEGKKERQKEERERDERRKVEEETVVLREGT